MPRNFERQLRAAQRGLEEAKQRRDALIVEASADGMSRRAVGAAVGLTAAGVQHVIATAEAKSSGDHGERTD